MNPPVLRYTALGDSIGFGLGASFFQGYTRMLGNTLIGLYPGSTFHNASKILAGSDNLLFQLKYNLRARKLIHSSNLLTICIGGNNLLRGVHNKYTNLDQTTALNGINNFAIEWPLILDEIRNSIRNSCPLYVMTLYNPCRVEDPRCLIFNEYITIINSILSSEDLINYFGYHIVDVYSMFESNPLKNWTHFYSGRRNIHPNNEGHRQIFLLHRAVMEV